MIVPHAGWRFSGDAAGRAFRWLSAAPTPPDLVVVFGSHRGPEDPNTVFQGDAWETPLGLIPVARALAQTLASSLGLSDEPARPRRPDNGVEVLLPFVRHFFPTAELLMLGVAPAPRAVDLGAEVAAACLTANRQAVFVGSTDLTHYGPRYGFAPHGAGPAAVQWARDNDRGLLDAACRLDALAVLEHGVRAQSACCPGAAAAALQAVRTVGGVGRAHVVDHYLSYDVHPDDNFVGYAGLVF